MGSRAVHRARHRNLALLICLVLPALTAATMWADAASGSATDASAPEAKINLWNRDIATLRATVAGSSPQLRAERAAEKLDELPLTARSADITAVPLQVEGQQGVAFMDEGKVLFFLGANDLDKESGETLAQATQRILQNLDVALRARYDERSWPVIRSGLLFTLVGLVLLITVVSLVWKSHERIVALLKRREPLVRAPLQLFGIDLRPPIDAAVYGLMRIVETVFVIAAIYTWTTLAMSRFPYTQPWSHRLGRYVLSLLQQWAQATVNALPGLLAVALIFVITRWIVRVAHSFFNQIAHGRIRVSWLDADMAGATQRIFAIIAWIFAVVVAYPYIPGSGTDAFKGISVLLGLVVSLGSTGIINQVMSGLFVVYSRALKRGEWVMVNDVEGEVLEVGLLAGKVRTIEGQEVTIPNSVLVGTSTKNFTRLGYPEGMVVSVTVTIGYDVPWRQVEGLLLLAADRTPGVRKHPKPHVLQRTLSDFYAGYTLIARIENAKLRMETLSDLHAQVQDAFNEYGVQIMSPHYMLQPAGAVVVPPAKWHSAPAIPDAADPGTAPKIQRVAADK
jgi:small-conductance mechanosensitive channel